MNEQVINLSIDDIIPNRFQPREVFKDQALDELALSIKEHGVIQPIIVRPIVNNKYEIIAGERRYKASTIAGKTTIPAIVRVLDDKETSKQALLENIQRQDLTPIEEARTYQTILSLDNITQEELAKTMGKSQSAISNKLRLLTLPEEVQEALLNSEISERHARSLLTVQDIEKQKSLLNEIISKKIPVRILDEMIKKENEGNNMNNNDMNVNNMNMLNTTMNPVINPGFLYDGNISQNVSVPNDNLQTIPNMINENVSSNITNVDQNVLNTQNQIAQFDVNQAVVQNTTVPNNNQFGPIVNNSNSSEEVTVVPSNEQINSVTNVGQAVESSSLATSSINSNLEPTEVTKETEVKNELDNTNLMINTDEINKEINKIINEPNTQMQEVKNEQTNISQTSEFDFNRFKKVDFNNEIKQTISGEEVIGEGLLAGKAVAETSKEVPENVVGKIDTIKVPAYILNQNSTNEGLNIKLPTNEVIVNENPINQPVVDSNINSMNNEILLANNNSNGQVLISQTGGMILPTNQEVSASNNSTEPNENIKNLINSQDLKLALIGIGNVINNLKARGIEVKEVRKTYSDHLELTLEIRKN